ncbi:EboA domain-containing protein (plasmid) [Photobacterium sp. GJ3]|uniref:EboA domain-containing protein n=1 Tax=Photobacterium sp. GJ3 TaxID=2829502 RepID=UPI001B8D5FB1|nr:EboA domain-containing protein [Photobacterium sp. GJ3]QUJ70124.1 EboA domain-containing protein [Photobacterium sp. GJ3]
MYSRRFDTPLSHFSPDALQSELNVMLDPASRTWLQVGRDKILDCRTLELAVNTLLLTSAMAQRKLGEEALRYQPEGTHWQVDQAARLLLLLTLRSIVPAVNWPELMLSIYRQFDVSEKIVTVRALDWLAANHELNPIAVETVNTSNLDLFSALALKNAYPVKFLNECTFLKLIQKAVLLDLNLEQIEGLPLRQSPELTKLCMDLVRERLHAEQDIPPSIWLGMRYRYLSDQGKDLYLGNVFSESEQHQYFTLLGLVNNGAQECPADFWQQLAKSAFSMAPHIRPLADELLSEARFSRTSSCFNTGHFRTS